MTKHTVSGLTIVPKGTYTTHPCDRGFWGIELTKEDLVRIDLNGGKEEVVFVSVKQLVGLLKGALKVKPASKRKNTNGFHIGERNGE